MHLLEQNQEKIVWNVLLLNPNARELLKHNYHKIDNGMWQSYGSDVMDILFTLDFKVMKHNNIEFAEEIAKKVFHPMRLHKLCEKYGLDLEEINDIY